MNNNLIAAGSLNAIAGLLHLGCIYFGAPWYRFFGAGEHMANMAEQGMMQPTLITLGIASVLMIWALFAFSGAGLIKGLPLVRLALVAITSIYLLRGVAGFYFVTNPIGRSPEFWVWSSSICLALGLLHLAGLKQQWLALKS
ncbi:hypothetical protein [Paraglaciecola marina]|uniref:hypothetical protein n=1 Tax=Paraglaciecola marina TaxID=2500157 RepID=UPI00105CE284|nr:hypothetical protein [Paraglaciecola marina]